MAAVILNNLPEFGGTRTPLKYYKEELIVSVDADKISRRRDTFNSRIQWLEDLVLFDDEVESLLNELSNVGFYYREDTKETVCETCGYKLTLEKGQSPAIKHWFDQPNCGTLRYFERYAPKHKEYLSEAARLSTFTKWPKAMKQTEKMMADAGFMYSGTSDKVFCFCCGGILKDWEVDDEPWFEHARWIPSCPFLFLKKGLDFIEDVHNELAEMENKMSSEPIIKKSVDTDIEETQTDGDQIECMICCTPSRLICFEPCGHAGLCGFCAFTTTRCPLCNCDIKGRIQMVY